MPARTTAYRALSVVMGAFLLVLILFRVTFDPEFALPKTVEIVDVEQEVRFDVCVAHRDVELHGDAFGTIDNPAVQHEFITANREAIRAECRAEFPRETIEVEQPFRFNLLDLEFRF